MADVVAECVVEGARWVVGRQVGGGEEGADREAGDAGYSLWWWRAWEVGIEVEGGRLWLIWACRALVPDGAGWPGGDW